MKLTDQIDPVTSLTVTKRNDSYLVSTLDSHLRLIDNRDGKLLRACSAVDEYVNDTYRSRSTFLKGDAIALAGSENGSILAWDILTGAVVGRVQHDEPQLQQKADGSKTSEGTVANKKDVISAVAACPARKEWCSAGGDGNVVVWA
jgi:mitogen-activated protein kinase organizer 1